MFSGPRIRIGNTFIYFNGLNYAPRNFPAGAQQDTGLTPCVILRVNRLKLEQGGSLSSGGHLNLNPTQDLRLSHDKLQKLPQGELTLENAKFYLAINCGTNDASAYTLGVTGLRHDNQEQLSSPLHLKQFSLVEATSRLIHVGFGEQPEDHWGWISKPKGVIDCPLNKRIVSGQAILSRFCEIASIKADPQWLQFEGAWLDIDAPGTISGINIEYFLAGSRNRKVFNWPHHVGQPS